MKLYVSFPGNRPWSDKSFQNLVIHKPSFASIVRNCNTIAIYVGRGLYRGNPSAGSCESCFASNFFPLLAVFIFLFEIDVFPLWRQDSVLELQIAALACVRNIVFCNSFFAYGNGVAVSRLPRCDSCMRNMILFLTWKLQIACNGDLRVANAIVAAKILRFWHYERFHWKLHQNRRFFVSKPRSVGSCLWSLCA